MKAASTQQHLSAPRSVPRILSDPDLQCLGGYKLGFDHRNVVTRWHVGTQTQNLMFYVSH
jgi:hypothetical protein